MQSASAPVVREWQHIGWSMEWPSALSKQDTVASWKPPSQKPALYQSISVRAGSHAGVGCELACQQPACSRLHKTSGSRLRTLDRERESAPVIPHPLRRCFWPGTRLLG